MKLYLSRRERRQLDVDELLAHIRYLRDELEAHHARLEERARMWPPNLPAGVDGYPIGGKTR